MKAYCENHIMDYRLCKAENDISNAVYISVQLTGLQEGEALWKIFCIW